MMDPIVRRLDRGLVLAVQPMPESPVVSAHLWFDAGATDERPEEAGVAHFVEHMLFKGTARRGVGEAAAAIEGLGGDLNAWTSYDETCFHATLEAQALGEALDVVLDMTSRSLVDAAELEREKQVVIEEIRGYDDDPDSVAADRMHALLFGAHPYGRPVIGWAHTVGAMDRGVVERFWRRNYPPGRALLSIAGPVDVDRVEAELRPWLAHWPAGEGRGVIPHIPADGRAVVERLDRDFGSVVVQLGWPGPGVGHPDLPALDVLLHALGGGASSRLQVLLDLEHGVASHVWADASAWLGGGIVAASFLCGETEDAVELAVAEICEVARSGLSGSVVARARDGLLADLMFAGETAEGAASDLAWWVARTGDPLGDRKYRSAVTAVSPADVRRVARTWLDPERMRVVAIDRELERRSLEAAVARGRKPPKRSGGAVRPDGLSTHELRGKGSRAPSLRAALLPDRGEIAAVKVLGVGGQLLETASLAGLSDAWSRMVLRGAGPRDPTAFAERADQLGVQIDASAGRSTVSVSATFPAHSTGEALELLADVLLDPHFSAEDWDNVREEVLDDQAALEDRPSVVGSELLWRALWPDHPWRLPTLGSATSIGRIGPKALRRMHDGAIATGNLAVAVAGGIDPDRVLQALEGLVAELPPRGARLPATKAGKITTSPRPRRAGKEQGIVLAGVRGLSLDDPDRTALVVATNLLDSQSGRLFLRLREERGLAYSVWAQSDAGVGGGVFSAGLATDPARVEEAADALLRELRLLAAEGPGDDELARTKRMLHGLAAMRQQRVIGRAGDLAHAVRFGLPYGLDALQERLDAVTPARVQAALERIGIAEPVRVTVLPK